MSAPRVDRTPHTYDPKKPCAGCGLNGCVLTLKRKSHGGRDGE